MKKIFKRVSAAVMALAVAATAVVFDVPEKLVAAAAVGNLSTDGYQLDNSGKLTIANDDGMKNYKSAVNKNKSEVKSVQINDDVSYITTNAFYEYTELASITIHNNVGKILDGAFYGCSKLVSVTLPENITSINENTFWYCESLTSITIPDSVTSIGASAFSRTGLTSITIPDSVNSIDSFAFGQCSNLTTVTILSSNININSLAFNNCKNLEAVILPSGLDVSSAIPATAAQVKYEVNNGKRNVTAIDLPTGKTSVTITDDMGISSVEENLRSKVAKTGHTHIYSDDVCQICGAADNRCGTSATWAYDDTTKTLTISGTGAMTDWTDTDSVPWAGKAADIQNVVIEEGITSIGKYAFKGCSSLTSITIPNGVTSIGSWAFDGCTDLTSITIPSSVTSIKTYAFQNCSKLTSITIPRGSQLANIGLRAFYNCSCLTAIDIPDSVTSIDQEAFSGCTSLMSITIPNGVTSISANTFNGCSNLSSITIPNSVNYIGTNAFYGCSSLTSITIPNDVTSIDDRAFSGCSSLSSITIPEKVATIGVSTFSNCTGLSSITIPNSVNKIYATAFSGCTNLKTVTFENVNPPATIGTTLFDNCSKLEKIFVPADSVEAYKAVERLDPYKDKITAAPADNKCGDNATWEYNEATKTLTISGTGAMDDWTTNNDVPWKEIAGEIVNVDIDSGITSIGDNAFADCTSLTDVSIPDSVTAIGDSAFNGCTSLTDVTIPDSVTAIGDSAFNGCTSLTDVTIPGSVTAIGDSAFNGCTSLTDVSIPDSVTTIGDNAFAGCTDLETVTFEGATPPAMGSDVFSGCSSMEEIVVPEGSEDAYKDDSSFTDLTDKITTDSNDGNTSDGNTSDGNTSDGNTSGVNTSGDNTSGDNSSGGNTSGVNTSGDNTSGDNSSGGNTSGGNTSGDNTSGDNTSGGNSSINTENTSKDIQLGENVPKTELSTPTEELISAVLDPEELAQLKDTDKVSIVLEIVDTVPAEDKQSVESYLESGEHVLAQYMDIALYKVINDSKTQITSTNKPIRITFEVPEGLRMAGRTFAVLRVHNGETVLLPDLDNDENTVTIETDKFSTYALVYRDNAPAADENNPSTGIAISLIPLTAALAAVTVAVKRRRK